MLLQVGRLRVVVESDAALASFPRGSYQVESKEDAVRTLWSTFPTNQPLWQAIFDMVDDVHGHLTVDVDDANDIEWTVLRIELQLTSTPPSKATWIRRHEYVLQHFEAALVNSTHPISATDVQEARASECHVVGCRLHAPSTISLVTRHSFNLPSLFKSLESPMEACQMAIRPDQWYVDRLTHGQSRALTDLPMNVIWDVLKYLNAREIAVMSMVNSLLQHVTYDTVPGLRLTLFAHQKKALKWMLFRESMSNRQLQCVPFCEVSIPVLTGYGYRASPHPYMVASWIDPVFGRVLAPASSSQHSRDSRGGFLCDEPGLGKTITMISLLLRTQGTISRPDDVDAPAWTAYGLRSTKHTGGRRVAASQLRPSHASLIIVPDTLMAHWSYQLDMHTTGLRVLLDVGKTVPDVSVLETVDVVVTSRAPERLGSENQRNYADGVEHKSLSPYVQLHWVRIIVDEGHKLGGTAITSAMQMLCSLSADKRWIMTGTPTPHVAQSDGLRHLHGLLRFLQELPYGADDDKPWIHAIAKPFEAKCIKGYLRLEQLLNRIMLRHVKADVTSIPPPIFITTVVDPTPVEFRIYNGVVGVVRGNLIVQYLKDKMNPLNIEAPSKDAMTAVSNLRLASCGGGTMQVLLSQKHYVETINFFDEFQMDWDRRMVVQQYMRDAQDGNCTVCETCGRELQFLMVTVCGHLVCADCIEAHVDAHGFERGSMRTTCPVCEASFDWESFQVLQPGFDYKWTADDAATPPPNNAQRPPPSASMSSSSAATATAVRPLHDNNNSNADDDDDHIWASSKGLYVLERIQSLLGRGNHPPTGRAIKCIVFSDFQEHIYRIRPDFARAGLRFVSFLSGEAKMSTRLQHLRDFRDNDDVHVLFMTEIGAIGLDLSFVTHIFLMDEIWDKSVEKQVIARAHRMGATESVVVEQLEMRGSMEKLVRELYAVPQPEWGDGAERQHHKEGGRVAHKKAKAKPTKSLFRVMNKETMSSLRLYHVLNHVRMIEDGKSNDKDRTKEDMQNGQIKRARIG
ncbi:hypothetical protein DYB30_007085 [Aphanomyces astaci]|uniref:F-box domain-containing protein n=2 Tax=Aphanomyces astaci TaxID=112090 RepID=A0A397CGW8_APHAT|nr:hypothetical protein DYB30_007085 [Aphanomyces astaci]RHZ01561.1 hypothetical protein DYB31_001862 [Aphanomyces astaci]